MKIILIRHGEPASANNNRVNAAGFEQWVQDYNQSRVAQSSRPTSAQLSDLDDYYIVSSHLPRAVHSAQIYSGKTPELIDPIFQEMDIPRYTLPLRLNAWHWVYLNRCLWVLGLPGKAESFASGRRRAKEAALTLHNLAQTHQKVVLFGHGFSNQFIGKALKKLGYTGSNRPQQFWDSNVFTRL